MAEQACSEKLQVRCQACGTHCGEFSVDTPHLYEAVLSAVEGHAVTAHGWTPVALAAQRGALYVALAARVRAAWGQGRAPDRGRRLQHLARTPT